MYYNDGLHLNSALVLAGTARDSSLEAPTVEQSLPDTHGSLASAVRPERPVQKRTWRSALHGVRRRSADLTSITELAL